MLSFRTVMAANEMETDERSHLQVSNGLRRSNSAPNISVAVFSHSVPTFHSVSLPRQRRFSVNSPSQNTITVGSPAFRVNQLIRDESVDNMVREVQKEKEIISTINLVHAGESMHLDNEKHDSPMHERRYSFECTTDMFPSPAPSSPSPTRFGRPIPGRNNGRSMTPSPIPSPTRTIQSRRSLSPVCLRPSMLSPTLPNLKRKGPPSYGMDLGVSPSKRVYDGPSHGTSIESPCETAHLNFDDVDVNYINIDHSISHVANSTSSSTSSSSVASVSPMMINDTLHNTHRIAFPAYRSRFTPPRSPLAGPAISQTHTDNSATITTTQTCFTFAPVRD